MCRVDFSQSKANKQRKNCNFRQFPLMPHWGREIEDLYTPETGSRYRRQSVALVAARRSVSYDGGLDARHAMDPRTWCRHNLYSMDQITSALQYESHAAAGQHGIFCCLEAYTTSFYTIAVNVWPTAAFRWPSRSFLWAGRQALQGSGISKEPMLYRRGLRPLLRVQQSALSRPKSYVVILRDNTQLFPQRASRTMQPSQ